MRASWIVGPYLVAAALFGVARPAAAGTAATHLTVGPLLSFQPVGDAGGSPYLDNGLGGTKPGLFLALERRTSWGGSLALELSTTTRMEVSQTGRLVARESGAPCNPFGSCGPALTRLTDTLASVLFGARIPLGSGGIEPKLGIGITLGNLHQGDLEVGMEERLALSGGVDAVVPITTRLELVPSFRYTWVRRQHEYRPDEPNHTTPAELGVDHDIVRVGVGLRFGLGR